jgi:SPP1 gp7 family putative phage head morphogenesis protein
MNSEQLRLFIAGAFGSEADAKKVRKMLTPYLKRTLDEIRQLVELLPDESLARQREWRSLLDLVEQRLEPYNNAFAVTLSDQLPVSGLSAAEETTLQLQSVVPRTAGLAPPAAVMADSTKYLLNTKVGPKRLIDLFTAKDGVSAFTKSNLRMIDSLVTGGIIEGLSTAKIAKAITSELPQRMQSQSLAIARTAIQDYNRQVKEEVWDANRDAFARLGLKYEWVSALDSRTCPTCAPLDGAIRDSKRDFPSTPVHVNCRCSVVLIDPEDPGRIRYGQEALVQKPSGAGAYKSKKKVKGERLYRKNKEIKTVDGQSPRYADFLAGANRKTQQMFFGGGNAGSIRAEKFRQSLKAKTPQQALIDLTNRVDKTRKVTTVKGAARRFKPADNLPATKSLPSKISQAEIDAVKKFTDFDFQAVSAAKYQQAKDAGKKLTEFESSRANIYGSETKQQLDNRLERARLVDSYIKKKKPYKGTVYRGVNLDTNGELQELWDSMQKRGTLSPESWTESKEIGVKFAGKGKARVLFELVENKSGASIKRISNKPKELEVLMPSGVKYEPIDMRVDEDGLRVIRVKEKR